MTDTLNKTVAFVGAGNMNGALIRGLISVGYPASKIWVSNRSEDKLNVLRNELGVNVSTNNNDVVAQADIIVLGVKPYQLKEVCQAFTERSGKVFVSVAAGVTLQQLSEVLGDDCAIVRAMPNTPSTLGLGMTGLTANSRVTEADRGAIESLFEASGKVLWVESDNDIDSVTAISGSGPAYFFLFMEGLIEAAESFGYTKEQARLLVAQTAKGAAAMVESQPDVDVSTLRHNVTSPGGTTAAAISHFQHENLTATVMNAAKAADSRAKELASEA